MARFQAGRDGTYSGFDPWSPAGTTPRADHRPGEACAKGTGVTTDTDGDDDLGGKVALVLGGTGGVGLRAAEKLARRGARVVVNGRSAENGARALASLRGITPDCHFARGSLTEAESLRQVIAETQSVFGGLDILVSAGAESAIGVKPFAEMTPEDIEQGFLSRFMPRVLPINIALPAFRERGAGSVVLLTTDAARHVTPGESIVGAAGAAVILITKALGRELARDNIRVNAVAMTLTSDTPSWDRIFAKEGFASKLFSKAVDRFPSGRPPTASEVAEVVAFLASPAASQVTGQTLSANGGLSFGGW